MFKKIVFFIFFSLVSNQVLAEETGDSDLIYMIVFEGQCKNALVKSINLTKFCKGIARTSTYKTGRTSFAFHTDNNIISFVGENDEKPSETKYKLDVFKIVLANTNDINDIQDIYVTGNCRVDGDITKKSSIKCSAKTSDNEKFEFNFHSVKFHTITE
jgi:hypothetical protein